MRKNTLQELNRILKNNILGLESCLSSLQTLPHQENFEKAVELLYQTLNRQGKIIFSGVGKSGNIALKMVATFNSSGSQSAFLHPTDALHGDSGLIQSKDCLFLLSYSGNTSEMFPFIEAVKNNHPYMPKIGMGRNPRSALAQSCDAWIQISIPSEACPYGLVPTTSTTSMLAVADAVALILMQKNNFQPQDFARVHPKGSLGKRLTIKVHHLMCPVSQCAFVTPETSVQNVLHLSSEKKQGTALVVDKKGFLLGIITDGDIRRGVLKNNAFALFLAQDIMSKNPITIHRDALIDEAFQIMEKRDSEISVLPVVDYDNKCIGLIRLHDIVKEI